MVLEIPIVITIYVTQMEETLKIYAIAQKIIGALNGIWWSKDIKKRKKIIYNTIVKSVLIYGAETRSLY
jgi:hypothetical protein